jgi:hypothetical protein
MSSYGDTKLFRLQSKDLLLLFGCPDKLKGFSLLHCSFCLMRRSVSRQRNWVNNTHGFDLSWISYASVLFEIISLVSLSQYKLQRNRTIYECWCDNIVPDFCMFVSVSVCFSMFIIRACSL